MATFNYAPQVSADSSAYEDQAYRAPWQFMDGYLVGDPARGTSLANDWQMYGYPDQHSFLSAILGPGYQAEQGTVDGKQQTVYKADPIYGFRPPDYQEDGGNWLDKTLKVVNLAVPAILAGGAAAGALGGAGGTTAGALEGGATATLADGSVATLGNAPGVGGTFANVSTAAGGAASSAVPVNAVAQWAVTNLGMSVEAANALVAAQQVGSAAGTVGQLASSLGNSGGGSEYGFSSQELPYNYDVNTGDTVGTGNTPLNSNYFTTNPPLDSPGYGGNPAGGNTDFFNAAKGILGTPGVSQLIGGGLNALGGVLGSRQQANAAGDANALQWRMYQQNREDLTPYRLAGYGALGGLIDMTTPGKQMDRLRLDPGYDFRRAEGQNALDMRQRAAGNFYSGAGLKGASEYNQNFASGEFNNAYNRLAALAGTGQAAANTTAQMGQQTAQGVANNTVDIGNARASGYAAGLGGIANGLNQYQNALQTQQLFDLLAKNRTP